MSEVFPNQSEVLANDKRAQLAELLRNKTPRRSEAPLSFAQQRLWFLDQMDPGSSSYNISRAARVKGPLNLTALTRSLNAIIKRHEALRTNFTLIAGEPVQVVLPSRKIEVQFVDLTAIENTRRELEAKRLATEAFQQPFDLSQDPLLRASLFKLEPEEHVLVLSMHHIVSDGWSMGVLFREIGTLYEAFSKRLPSPLEELPIQYRDFALWQRDRLQGEVLDEQLDYWKKQLEGTAAVLEIPTDRPRPAIQTFNGGYFTKPLSLELSKSLNELCRRQNVTMFMALLAAFQTLLYRYSGQSDVVVGTPIANRTRKETEELIGFFVNTLVMRTDVSGEPSFRELLGRVKEVALGAYAHQELPFEKLVEELQPERTLGHMPLFQVLFALQNAPRTILSLSSLELEEYGFDRKTSKFDLSLYVGERPEGLILSFEYNTDLFNTSTIERMADHFEILLKAIVVNPDQSVSHLAILPQSEQKQLLLDWNDTETEYPRNLCGHDLFEEQVKRTPDAVAGRFGDETISYAELNRKANQLAHHLMSRGVGPDTLVAIFLDRSLEMIVGLLGILKAGAAYLPLDISFPSERLAYMLHDANVSVVVTQEVLLSMLPQGEAEIICIDRDAGKIALESTENPIGCAREENLAYVIYTSGSTGKPKGVEIPHRALVNFLTSMRQQPGIIPRDILLSVTTLSFDIAGLELYLPLTVGACVVIASREVAVNGAELSELLKNCGATVMQATPATWRLLLEAGWRPGAGFRILCGGEALPRDLADQLLARSQVLWNLYGPTETTIWSTIGRIDPTNSEITIGRPIANTQIYILDRELRPTPIGVAGELYIGGDGLGRGYRKRPDLTAEKFIPSPFAKRQGERLYRTGDLARFRDNGTIEVLGRLDHQVKVRGYRIELGEIESALSSHAMVQQCVVTATPDTTGEQRLVGYFVPDLQALPTQGGGLFEWHTEQIAQWQSVWDETYSEDDSVSDPTFNISGWKDSYTGLPIPAEQMRDWVENTLARILSLQPRRLMEIGCGTGLLAFRLAPHCDEYVGTDFSTTALRNVQAGMHLDAKHSQIKLLERTADNFEGIADNSLDAVVINSVVQYFPSADYLLGVLEKAVNAIESGGFVFVGDVRNFSLLELFHASVQLQHAESSLQSQELIQRVRRLLDQEEELLIDPAYFRELPKRIPRIRHVEIQLKKGRDENELTKFRYDVILHIGSGQHFSSTPETVDWQKGRLTLAALRQLLVEGLPEQLRVMRIPNKRLSAEAELLKLLAGSSIPKTVGEIRRTLREANCDDAIDPEDLRTLARELSYEVELGFTELEKPGSFDVTLTKRTVEKRALQEREQTQDSTPASYGKFPQQFVNNPLRGKLYGFLLGELRSHLKDCLPDYMVPPALVMLDAFPLTPNGKLDRRALPAPRVVLPTSKESGEAKTEHELALKRIWEKLLNVSPIGTRDNFFELGGHSLLAVRLVNEVAKVYGKKIPLVSLFQGATIEQLASLLREDDQRSWPTLIEIQAGDSRPPVFCVSTPNVNALGYVFLARHLGSDQPVYGLQAQYPEDLQGEHSRKAVEELATDYLQALRTIRPKGPYQFVGMCRGSHIAYEMARRLEEEGQETSFLGILDTWVMENTYSYIWYLEYYARRLFSSLHRRPQDLLEIIGRKTRGLIGRIGASRSLNGSGVKSSLTNPLHETYFPGPEFVPKLYGGRITVFRSRRQPLNRIRDRALGWGRLTTRGVDVHIVPGMHGLVLREPHVRRLAMEMKNYLLGNVLSDSELAPSMKVPSVLSQKTNTPAQPERLQVNSE